MALREANKIVSAENTNKIEVVPKSGTALIVKGIYIKTNADDIAVIKNAATTMMAVKVSNDYRNMLAFPSNGLGTVNLFDELKKKGFEISFPVPQGEKFTIETTNNVAYATIVYDEYDAGDITAEMPNHPDSSIRRMVICGTNANDITDVKPYRLDKFLGPVELHSWPFEEEACPYSTVRIKAIGIKGVEENNYTGGTDNKARTKYATIWLGTKQIVTEVGSKILAIGANAPTGESGVSYDADLEMMPCVSVRSKAELVILDQDIVVARGQELRILLEIVKDTTNAKISAEKAFASIIAEVEM